LSIEVTGLEKSKKGSWGQALVTFFSPILGIVLLRWLLFEPFVIPSGSMIPTLLVHDHIVVNKTSFGVRIPFVENWSWQWASPRRGEIVVFRFPKKPEIFYVKRVVALAGDEIGMRSGHLIVNGQKLERTSSTRTWSSAEGDDEDFDYFLEAGHPIRYRKDEVQFAEMAPVKVPPGHFFVIGDNRDQSSDSRMWGFVPEQNLVGRPTWIWLSCDKTLPSAPFVCDPQSLRWARMLTRVF
jgi:signal peptidase I